MSKQLFLECKGLIDNNEFVKAKPLCKKLCKNNKNHHSYNLNEVSAALTGLSHRWIIKSFIPLGMLILFLAGLSILLKNLILFISLNLHIFYLYYL